MTPSMAILSAVGANGNMGYKLTDNIGYTFVSVLRADRADHQHDFWRLDPPVLACPARLPDPPASSAGYCSAGEQPERRISPTGLHASGPQCQGDLAAAARVAWHPPPLAQCAKLRGSGGWPP